MGMTDVLTAQYFCDLIGVSTVETTSIRKSNSLEGDIAEYGQKNVATLKRNLLNVDETLRIPANKLKDNPISEYKPKWIKNVLVKDVNVEKAKNKEKLGWNNF